MNIQLQSSDWHSLRIPAQPRRQLFKALSTPPQFSWISQTATPVPVQSLWHRPAGQVLHLGPFFPIHVIYLKYGTTTCGMKSYTFQSHSHSQQWRTVLLTTPLPGFPRILSFTTLSVLSENLVMYSTQFSISTALCNCTVCM